MNCKSIASALAILITLNLSAQRIAVLSDIHVTPGSANEGAMRTAVEEINKTPYDLVVVNGDLGTEGSDWELTNVKGILDKIKHPTFLIPGNHESTWSQSATKTFIDLWGNDRFVAETDSIILIGISCGPYMKMGNGNIKQEDLHWLDETLGKMTTSGKKVLSFNHYPLLSDLDNLDDYLAILERYPVIGHINGHYHTWKSYNAGGPESGSDLPCVMVRALDMGKGDYGYSEIEIDPSWVHIYNKRIGYPRQAKYAFANTIDHKKSKKKEKPQIIAPKNFEVQKLWSDNASVFTRLGFDKNNVYFGTSTGNAQAVSKNDGAIRWTVPTGASLFSRPVSLGKDVAVPMHNGIMFIDATTGKVRSKHKSKEGPYVADGTITPDGKGYIQGGYKRIERLNPVNGKIVWVYDSIFNYCQAAPAIEGNDLVFGAWDTKLRMLDLRTGKLRWAWDNGMNGNLFSPGNVVPVISGDKVFVVTPDRYMTALDRSSGRQLWRDNSHRYRESIGHSEDGSRIYAKTMDGELVAVDATAPEFKELWTIDLGLGYEHAPCVIVEKDGYIYTGSLKGKVTVTRADNHELLASLPLGCSEVNGIDVDPFNGDIYVSLIEGTIFRIRNNN